MPLDDTRIVWAPQPGPQKALVDCPFMEVLFGGSRGGGKGQPLDAVVATPFGFRAIGDLEVGSAVCGPDSSVGQVIATYDLGERQIFSVAFADGTSTEVTDDHIWLAWRSNHAVKRAGIRTTGEDASRLYLTSDLMRQIENGAAFRVPLAEPVRMTVASRWGVRPIDAYALGALLGDGSLSDGGLRLTSCDPEIAEMVAVGIGPYRGPYTYAGRAPEYVFREGDTRKHLEKFGLAGAGSFHKFIPKEYLVGTIDERWALLRGLMDTDGWAEADGDTYYCTVSRRLRDDVALLARSLGAYVTLREKNARDQHGNGSLAYTLRIKVADGAQLFTLDRKRQSCGRAPQSMGRPIVSIVPTRIAFARCIKVSHPSGLYLTNDYILTHNTDGIIGKWAIKSWRYGAAFNAVFFRKEMPQADDLVERAREVYGPMGGEWREQPRMFRMPGGGRVRFRPLENTTDAQKYQGQNLSDVAVEEAGNYEDPAPIDMLFGALRSKSGVPVQMMLTANPGGPGQQWIKHRYIDPAPLGMVPLTRKLPNGALHQYIYIPSRVQDNRILLEKDPDYINRLYLVGSPALVRAWLEGDWGVVAGAFFPEFSIARHVVAPRELPMYWHRFRSFDWGSARPFCCGWYAVSDGELPAFPRGALVKYREWYGAQQDADGNTVPNKGLRLTAEEIAAGILERERDDLTGTKQMGGVADPSIFTQDGGPSHADRMAVRKVFFRAADNTRVPKLGAMGGWDQVRSRLKGDGERPALYFFSTCRDTIRTLPALQHDDGRPEDIATEGEDHAGDETRYACMSRPYTAPLPPDMEPAKDRYARKWRPGKTRGSAWAA